MSGRRVFVGDIQGCLDPLRRLLDAVAFDPTADQLLAAGDLVNKGPDNVGVVRLLMDLGARGVMGNHDLHALRIAAGIRPAKASDTAVDLLAADDRDALLDWIAALPVMIHLGDVVMVHAAIRPTWRDLPAVAAELNRRLVDDLDVGDSPFDDDDLRFAMTARYCTEEGEQADPDWPPPGPPYRNWVEFYEGEPTVVFGHFARQGLVVTDRVRGLDTGCVYGNELTAWIAEEDRVVSVPAKG